jgi:hypothetical protein
MFTCGLFVLGVVLSWSLLVRVGVAVFSFCAAQGAYTTLAMCGFVRQNGEGDAALTRLWDEKQRGELRGQ